MKKVVEGYIFKSEFKKIGKSYINIPHNELLTMPTLSKNVWYGPNENIKVRVTVEII